MGELGSVLNHFFEEAPLFGRVFFASIELLLVVPLLVLAVKVRLIRTYRLQSLLWLFVLLNIIVGTAYQAPVDITIWRNEAPLPPVVTASSNNVFRPTLREKPTDTGPSATWPKVGDLSLRMTPPTGVTPPAIAVKAVPAWWSSLTTYELLGGLWVLGALTMLGNLLVERWRLRQLLGRTHAPSAPLSAQYASEMKALETWWTPKLRVTHELESPAIVGVFRPVILVPKWLEVDGTTDQWSWTLRHELTHWRHGDTLGQMIRLATQALFFFHPCVWWAGKRWEEAAELACDRSLLRNEYDAVGYAQELCELLGMIGKRQRPLMSTGLFASRSHIGRRIEILLGDPLALPGRLGLLQRAVAVVVLIAMLGIDLGNTNAASPAITPVVPPVSATVPTAAASSGPRVLNFPETYSMGSVYFNGTRMEAQGRIEVPEGAQISLSINEAGAADLSPLATFGPNDLDSLNLVGTSVQDAQLAHISGLTGLRDIDIERTPIGDGGMAHLADLVNLEVLCVDGTFVGDAGMAYVENMTQMRDLELNRSLVTDQGLYYIRNLTQINRLDMWMLDITDEGMQYLAGLEKLHELGIEDTLITDAGLRYLEGMTHLDGINLENNNITDAGLVSLAKLPNLTRISLVDTYLTDAGMTLLAQFPQLQAAILPMQIGPEGLQALDGTAVGQFAASQAGDRRPVTIEVTGEGKRLPGAHFLLVETLSPGDEEVHVFRTDAQGNAKLYLPVRLTPYRLRAFAKGYVTNEAEWAVPTPDHLAVNLEAASVIGGTIVDSSGQPVAGVAVSIPVLGGYNWDAQEPLPHTVVTDEKGHWDCDVAPKELRDFWVSLDHRDYATTTYGVGDLPVAALRDGTAVLSIADAIGLPGEVVDDSGTPVTGVRITELEKWRMNDLRATGRAAVSDVEGSFELKPVRPGETLLRVEAAGLAPQMKTVNVSAAMAPVRIVLNRPGVLRGLVVDESETPQAGIQVYAYAYGAQGANLGRWRGETDSQGNFEWNEAPTSEIQLSFRLNDTMNHGVQISFDKSQEERQVFILPFKAYLTDGIDAGKLLLERFNETHVPEKFGAITLQLYVTEEFMPDPFRERRYEYTKSSDGRYRSELTFVGSDSGYVPRTITWDGDVGVINGLPGSGDTPDQGALRFVVADTALAPGYPREFESFLPVFSGPEAPTRRWQVLGFDDGVLTLGEDGTTRMSIRFVDTETLAYDNVVHFGVDGAREYDFQIESWIEHEGLAIPERIAGHYSYQDKKGDALFVLESFQKLEVADEDFTQTIPWEDGVTVANLDGTKQISVLECDQNLVKQKKYGAILSANLVVVP